MSVERQPQETSGRGIIESIPQPRMLFKVHPRMRERELARVKAIFEEFKCQAPWGETRLLHHFQFTPRNSNRRYNSTVHGCLERGGGCRGYESRDGHQFYFSCFGTSVLNPLPNYLVGCNFPCCCKYYECRFLSLETGIRQGTRFCWRPRHSL